MIARLRQELWFPDPETVPEVSGAPGLVAVGGDFSPERLLLAYRSGIFPWTDNPPSWWSPDPRGIIELDAFHIPRSLQRVLNRSPFRIGINSAFREVMSGCRESKPGREGTWVTDAFVAAYTKLHELGHAHSVECWLGDKLVGGIYGVAVGGLFAGESMFYHEPNASKIALVELVKRLSRSGFTLFDVQMVTPTTTMFGAREIARTEYLRRLRLAVAKPCVFPPN